jgi:DNA-binding winged helix-turn-helix (wHTH) protein
MNFDPQTNLVDVYVGYLRRKLGEPIIETVRGTGYRLHVPGQAALHSEIARPDQPPAPGDRTA